MALIQRNIHDKNQFGQIARKAPWYLLSSLMTRAASFLLLPVYTAYLTPEDYGKLGILESILQLMPLLLSFSMHAGFSRYFHDKKHNDDDVRLLFSSHFWFVLSWGGLATLLFAATSNWTVQRIIEIPFVPVVILVSIIPLLNQITLLGTQLLRVNLHTKAVAIIELVSFAAHTTIAMLTLVVFELGYVSKVWGMLAAASVSMFAILVIVRRHQLLVFRVDLRQLKDSFLFSVPLIPAAAAVWINVASDKLILAHYRPLADVGLYSIAVQMVFAVRAFQNSVTLVQTQIGLSALVDDIEKGKQKIASFLDYYIFLMGTIYIVFFIWIRELLYALTTPAFHEAYKLVWVLASTPILGGLYRTFMPILRFHKRTGTISMAAILSATANALANIALIPSYGKNAAIWTTLLSTLIYAGWVIGQAQKLDKTPIHFNVIAPVTLFMGICLSVTVYFDPILAAADWRNLALKAGLTTGLIVMNLMNPSTRKIVHDFYRKVSEKLEK